MSVVTLSLEDCEMIERCVDMISMQCKMVANMLRRSRAASGVPTTYQSDFGVESNDGMADMLANAASTLNSAARQISTDTGSVSDTHSRKRPRSRQNISYMDISDDHSGGFDTASPHAATPIHVKRRGRPPRDYGEELGPAFAMYASENYMNTEQSLAERAGGAPGSTRLPRGDVLRAMWDSWWLSSQGVKDKYLNLSRQEMTENETHMLELLLDYPLPQEASVAQTGGRSMGYNRHSLSPQPTTPFDAFLREQIPLLRSKVPDWSDAEISRRLAVNWNSMSAADHERYEMPATQQSAYPISAAPTTPIGNTSVSRGYPSSGGQRSGPRGPGHSAPRRAYVLFCRQERPMLVHENPSWDLPTVNKELGRRWKELSPDKKDYYHRLESKEAESRASLNASPQNGSAYAMRGNGAYQRPGGYFGGASSVPLGHSPVRPTSAVGSAMHRSGGKPGAPGSGNPNKGPSKAYVLYSRLNRKGVTSEHPEWDLATINRELGRMWKSLSTEERHTWESRAIAAANGDTEYAMSTPKRYASPSVAPAAAPAHVGSTSTLTPSPIPTAIAVSGDYTTASTPATPASGADTPTTKNGAVHSDHHDYDGEGEAEDVEMQDDDTDSGSSGQHYGHFDGQTQKHIPAGAVSVDSSLPVAPVSPHGPNAAAVTLPKRPSPSSSSAVASATRPPPMAKPAVVATSPIKSSGPNHTGSAKIEDLGNSTLHSVEASKGT
ncbi:hypothetical protein IW140_003990 [Coemansia sp. RSA 1813]|nr:High mobility group box 1 [Coemansia sp. RSA 1646]KAJ1771102.1 hypothetical protein LPJ74_002595 [Coemansia sp. RSA 1843]KAJ2088507.1 hypothetical protein IW138_004195 [Coemansia sp. RSA 986]KAJ2217101.1 hypothetical protein EV179_000868 [Coemansia sp. RSA 487]KAJ2568262.1 hypothetical protein IW140_003990 [Coemansia sp. RSA 1813]